MAEEDGSRPGRMAPSRSTCPTASGSPPGAQRRPVGRARGPPGGRSVLPRTGRTRQSSMRSSRCSRASSVALWGDVTTLAVGAAVGAAADPRRAVALDIDWDRAHLFDGQTGLALTS